jgi:hypothetical protein
MSRTNGLKRLMVFFFLTGYFTFGPVSIEVGTSTNECSIGLVWNCVVEVEVMYVPHLPPLPAISEAGSRKSLRGVRVFGGQL